MYVNIINFAHTQKIIIITMSLFLHDCVCYHHYDSVLIQFRSPSLFHSESQLLIEQLKRGIGREVNAIEAGVSPEV